MLIIHEELWESDKIIKVSTSKDWESADCGLLVQCSLDKLKEMIENNEGRPAVVIIDCNKGALPPLSMFVKMFAFLAKIRNILSVKLTFTIVYVKSDQEQQTVDNILKMYKSVRPIIKAQTKDDIHNIMLQRDIAEAEMRSFDDEDDTLEID